MTKKPKTPSPRLPREFVEKAMRDFIETTHYYAPGSNMQEFGEPGPDELPPDPTPDEDDT